MKLPGAASGQRLDRAITHGLRAAGRDVTVREVRLALTEQRILVDGRPRAAGSMARGHEDVDLSRFVARREAVVAPEPELLSRSPVRAEWSDVFALDKPSGPACAPLRAGERGTLLGAAIAHDAGVARAGPPLEGGLLHRLDGGTSGLVLFARTSEARETGRAWFSAHTLEKSYAALIRPPEKDLPAELDAPIGPGPTPDRVRAGDGPKAQRALSRFTVLARKPDRWRVRVETVFGRRHQVRAHLALLGAPLLGDVLYGGPEAPRLMLHAWTLRLPDGRAIEAPVPEVMRW